MVSVLCYNVFRLFLDVPKGPRRVFALLAAAESFHPDSQPLLMVTPISTSQPSSRLGGWQVGNWTGIAYVI